MFSTDKIANQYYVSTETLESWLSGNQPKSGYNTFLYHEIFSKFKYLDGQWHPLVKSIENNPEKNQADRSKLSNK